MVSKIARTEKDIIREMEYLMATKEGDEKDRINRIKKLSLQLGEIVFKNSCNRGNDTHEIA